VTGSILGSKSARELREAVVIHKGIEYTVSPTVDPEIWRWQFQVADKVYVGRTRTRLAGLAARRARLKINAALKQSLSQAENKGQVAGPRLREDDQSLRRDGITPLTPAHENS
jgi:hypothetical protein